ncbi:Nicalin [Halotydeus destructor]|nr:Nicalin [Halotydeus destructor]
MFSIAESLFGDSSSPASSTMTAIFALFAVMPFLLVLSAGPVLANADISVNRMQQYDFQGSPRGCRSSLLNLEATTVKHFNENFSRKCVIIRLLDLVTTNGAYEDLLSKSSASGLLILLPTNEEIASLSVDDLQSIQQLEKTMLSDSTPTPVYFAYESDELRSIYQEIERFKGSKETNESSSVLGMVFGNAYQVSVADAQPSAIKDPVMTNIEGKLFAVGPNDQLPTIVVTAHYDSLGVAPSLSVGSDSNGSGVVALLELARLFNKLYSNPKSQIRANLVFVLTAAGKYSYLGSKKWIEENLDNSENGILTEAHFVMSLESLASTDSLYMHVSKVPKESSSSASFFKKLQEAGSSRGKNVSMISKKINLADESLAWEHERFTYRRLPAFTISSLNTHKSLNRNSMFDVRDRLDSDVFITNIEIITEALASQVLPQIRGRQAEIFSSELEVSSKFVQSMLSQVSSQPRSQQLLITQVQGRKHILSSFVSTLEFTLRKLVKHVSLQHFKLDQREPEVVFYGPTTAKLNVYNVKHAIFDLVISFGIGAYLTLLFLALSYFHKFQRLFQSFKISSSTSNGVASRK